MSLGQFGLLYLSMAAGMPPGLAALVLQAQVIFTVVIAAGVLRERPTAAQVAGITLGTVGLVVVGVGRGGHVTAAALALCLLAALSWGIGNVVSRASGVTGGLSLTVWSAVVVPVPLLALSLLLDGPGAVATALAGFSWQAVLSTLYTAGLASLVGYGIFNSLLSRNASAYVVPWVLLAPGRGDGVGVAAARPGAERRRDRRRAGADRRACSWPCARPGPQSPSPTTDRPASSRATGTRNGEQDT